MPRFFQGYPSLTTRYWQLTSPTSLASTLCDYHFPIFVVLSPLASSANDVISYTDGDGHSEIIWRGGDAAPGSEGSLIVTALISFGRGRACAAID